MEPFLSKTVGGRHVRWSITISVHVCLIMNHGTIVQQNSRGGHVINFAVSVRVCLIMNHGTSYRGRHMRQLIPFLIASVLHMDHGTISNGQIVWWGSLRLAPIIHQVHAVSSAHGA